MNTISMKSLSWGVACALYVYIYVVVVVILQMRQTSLFFRFIKKIYSKHVPTNGLSIVGRRNIFSLRNILNQRAELHMMHVFLFLLTEKKSRVVQIPSCVVTWICSLALFHFFYEYSVSIGCAKFCFQAIRSDIFILILE